MDINMSEWKDTILANVNKAADSVKDLAGGAKGFYDRAAEMAKAGSRIAKLSMEAATIREDTKKTYLEIGKLYYDTHKEDPEGFFIQLFEEVRVAEEAVAAKEAELAALRESFHNDSAEISVDFEEVVDKAEAEAEAVRDAVEDTFQEVKDAVEEKADSIRDAVSGQEDNRGGETEEDAWDTED